jgi:hypothetical protein
MEQLLAFLFIVGVAWWWKGRQDRQRSLQRPPAPPQPSPVPAAAPPADSVSVQYTVTESREVHGSLETAQDSDAWDQEALDGYFMGALRPLTNVRLKMQYVDADGVITQREATTISFVLGLQGEGYLKAFCHLRNANRFFRFSRMSKVSELPSGASIDSIATFLQQRFDETPRGVADRFLSEHHLAMQCLFAMGRADGAFRAKEKEILLAFASKHGLAPGAAQEATLLELKACFGGTKQEFWAAAKALTKHSFGADYLPMLLQALDAMMRSSAGVDRSEQLLLEYAARTWNMPVPGPANEQRS